MASVNFKQLAKHFIDEARRAPDPFARANALRIGASAFATLAADPRNVNKAKKLTAIGFEFVGAATKAQQATITDFEDLLRTTANAWEDLGQDAAFGHGDMDLAATSRDLALANSSAAAQIVSIAPQSFNADTTLGRVVTVKFNPSDEEKANGIVQSQTVAFWQGAKREAQAMTVDVGPTLLPINVDLPAFESVNPIDSRPYAIVEYGSDGNRTNNIVMDVRLGHRATVVGNYVSVIVGMDAPQVFAGGVRVPAESPKLTLGASIGCFAAPSLAPVFRTVFFTPEDVAEDGNSTIVKPIPSRGVYLHRPLFGNAFSGNMRVVFYDFGGNEVSLERFALGPLTNANAQMWANPFPMVVPYNAYFFNFIFTDASVNPIPIQAPFQLSL